MNNEYLSYLHREWDQIDGAGSNIPEQRDLESLFRDTEGLITINEDQLTWLRQNKSVRGRLLGLIRYIGRCRSALIQSMGAEHQADAKIGEEMGLNGKEYAIISGIENGRFEMLEKAEEQALASNGKPINPKRRRVRESLEKSGYPGMGEHAPAN